jgi:translation initiation factor 2 alpha subunit (eIF-2alpha)
VIFSDPEGVFGDFEMQENVKRELLSYIRKRLTPQAVKVRAGISSFLVF